MLSGRAQNMLPGRAQNMFYISNIRYLSILTFSSLHRLAYDIGVVYDGLSDLFPGLTGEKVRDIQQSIKDGRYTLSPLQVRVIPKNEEDLTCSKFNHLMSVKDEPNIYLGVNPTLEDSLVLIGLGRMLNLNILQENILSKNSFGIKPLRKEGYCISDYYSIVCARGRVFKLFKLDLTNSLRTINRDNLLFNLSHIVKDGQTMELLGQYMYLPITDSSGIDYSANMGINIPPSGPNGLLSEVLLNFALIEFDSEFQRLYPQVVYTRYVHEVLVSFPTSESLHGMTLSIFEQQVLSLFKDLNLAGKIISIGPGDAPVRCHGGVLSVSQDGIIQVNKIKNV